MRAPRQVSRHLFAMSLVLCSHAMNITIPWTLGVYMVRSFLRSSNPGVDGFLTNPAVSVQTQEYPGNLWTVPQFLPFIDERHEAQLFQALNESTENDSAEKIERLVGYRAGFLSASFSGAQVLTAFMWGSLANKHGTRILIQISQISGCLGFLALGFAPNYASAVTARFVVGLLNSITGSFKTNVAKSYHISHQPKIFATTMSYWAVGSIVGPSVGGLLAEPCTTWPIASSWSMCHEKGLFMRYPFLLPCSIGALLSLVSAIVTHMHLLDETEVLESWPPEHESLPRRFSEDCSASVASQVSDVDICAILDETINQDPPALTATSGEGSGAVVKDGKLLSGSTEEEEIHLLEMRHLHEVLETEAPWWQDWRVIARLMGYGSSAILFSMLGESMPIFVSMPFQNGGLEWSTSQFAIPSGIGGIALIISSKLIYPRVQRSLGNIWCVVTGLLLTIPVIMLYPMTSFLRSSEVLMPVFCCLYSLQQTFGNFCFASGNVLVNEAALKYKNQVGSVNGAGHMLSSAVRALGPASIGILWSLITGFHLKLGFFIPFVCCSCFAAIEVLFYLFFVPLVH